MLHQKIEEALEVAKQFNLTLTTPIPLKRKGGKPAILRGVLTMLAKVGVPDLQFEEILEIISDTAGEIGLPAGTLALTRIDGHLGGGERN